MIDTRCGRIEEPPRGPATAAGCCGAGRCGRGFARRSGHAPSGRDGRSGGCAFSAAEGAAPPARVSALILLAPPTCASAGYIAIAPLAVAAPTPPPCGDDLPMRETSRETDLIRLRIGAGPQERWSYSPGPARGASLPISSAAVVAGGAGSVGHSRVRTGAVAAHHATTAIVWIAAHVLVARGDSGTGCAACCGSG